MKLPIIKNTDIKDALSRFDKLTQEETRMAVARNWKATHRVKLAEQGHTICKQGDAVAR